LRKGNWISWTLLLKIIIWGDRDEISIYRAYVLRYVMENRQDLVPRYLAKIMARHPDEPELGAIALAYGYQYKQMSQINALFDSLKDTLLYTPEDIYRSIQEEMGNQSY